MKSNLSKKQLSKNWVKLTDLIKIMIQKMKNYF